MASVAKSVRLSSELIQSLRKVARKNRCTESEIIQKAVRKFCAEALVPPEGSVYDRVKHLLGGFQGPPDLRKNSRKYITEAIYAKRERNRRTGRRRAAGGPNR
jgi:hypothetical protein